MSFSQNLKNYADRAPPPNFRDDDNEGAIILETVENPLQRSQSGSGTTAFSSADSDLSSHCVSSAALDRSLRANGGLLSTTDPPLVPPLVPDGIHPPTRTSKQAPVFSDALALSSDPASGNRSSLTAPRRSLLTSALGAAPPAQPPEIDAPIILVAETEESSLPSSSSDASPLYTSRPLLLGDIEARQTVLGANVSVKEDEDEDEAKKTRDKTPWKGAPIRTSLGRGGTVFSVCYSPDGRSIATGCEDAMVRVFSSSFESEPLAMKGHIGFVRAVCYSPDGKMIASGSSDRTVKVWGAKGCVQSLYSIKGHEGSVRSVCYSPDGSILVSGSEDNTVRVWSTTGELLQIMKDHTNFVTSVCCSNDGSRIFSGSDDKTVRVWSRTGELLKTLVGHTGSISSVRDSPDGKSIASGSHDNTVRMWSTAGELLQTINGHKDWVTSVCFSPDGKNVASGSWDNAVNVWSISGELLQSIDGNEDCVSSVCYSPDGRSIAAGSLNRVVVYNPQPENLIADPQLDALLIPNLLPDTYLPSSSPLLASSETATDEAIQVEEENQGIPERAFERLPFINIIRNTGFARIVCYSPDGKKIATCSDGSEVLLWRINGELLKTISTKMHDTLSPVRSMCFKPDGSSIAVGTLNSFSVFSIAGKRLQTLKGPRGNVTSLCYSPDGTRIASCCSADSTVRVWGSTCELLMAMEGHTGRVNSVCYSPDGNNIVSGSNDNTVKLWSTTGELLQTMTGHKDWVFSVCCSPDGNSVASGSLDRTVRLWSIAGELLHTMIGHTDRVVSISFSVCGSSIASGSFDNTVNIWSISGACLHTINGHTDRVTSVSFSPDGSTMASASGDNTVNVYNCEFIRSSRSSSGLGSGLARLDMKLIVDGLERMLDAEVPLDILYWEEYLEFKHQNPDEFCKRLALLFSATWQVILNNNAVEYNSDDAKERGASIQGSIQRLVDDVRQHRPQLLVELLQRLDDKHIQELAETRVMQILINELAKGGVNKLYYFEVFMFVVLVVTFTRTSYVFKFATSVDEVIKDFDSMRWASCTLIIASLFMCREIGQIVAMARLKLVDAYFKDFFNYLDMGALTCILGSTCFFFVYGPGDNYNTTASVAALLMWLKLLGTIKALNPQIATFVLMLRIILRDISAFVAVMVIVLVMFGHALFMMLGSSDPDSDNGFATVFDTMKTLYISMVTGQYDSDNFPDAYTYSLSAIFLFIVVIVMLNVLIAIVSDSYDAAVVKSAQLFWSARMGLVAEISTTFSWLLKTKAFETKAFENFAAIATVLETSAALNPHANAVKRFFEHVVGPIFFDKKENILLEGIRICCLPVTFSVLSVLFICHTGLMWLSKVFLRLVSFVSSSSKLELKLGQSSSSGDEWSGRVLDIVRRINQHSTEKADEMRSELTQDRSERTAMNMCVANLHCELAAIKEGDAQSRLEMAAMKEDFLREMRAFKELLRH